MPLYCAVCLTVDYVSTTPSNNLRNQKNLGLCPVQASQKDVPKKSLEVNWSGETRYPKEMRTGAGRWGPGQNKPA